MFRVKVCGITRHEDAADALAAGVDALGFNFYRPGKRFVEPSHASDMVSSVGGAALCVGVFVNETADGIARIVEAVGLDAIQLHGDEPSQLLANLPSSVPIIRARRLDEQGCQPIVDGLIAAGQAGRRPDALLIDAAAPGEYGGTGKTADWDALADYQSWLGDTPLILAGGLTPKNVGAAIRQVRPHGVDVASGVELSPGIKSLELVNLFQAEALAAF